MSSYYNVNRVGKDFYAQIYPIIQRLVLLLEVLEGYSDNPRGFDQKQLMEYLTSLRTLRESIKEKYYDQVRPTETDAKDIMDIVNSSLTFLSDPMPKALPYIVTDLKAVICDKLLGISYQALTEEKLRALMSFTSVDLSTCATRESVSLDDLEGIGIFTSVETFVADCHDINDITDLRFVPGLGQLSLNYNQVSTLEGIDVLIGLRQLSLRGNQLTSLKGIENLRYLKRIDISNNSTLSSIQPLLELLEKSKHLRHVTLDCDNIPVHEYQQLLNMRVKPNCL